VAIEYMKKHISNNKIIGFIEKNLVKEIQKDLVNFQIINERDFESMIFYHLWNFLKSDESIKISTNYMMKGLRVRKKKRSRWTTATFIMPDIVISRKPEDYTDRLEHVVAFELKTRSPGQINSPNFNSETFELDFRKLHILKKEKKVKKAYYFLVYSDEKDNETDVKKQIKKLRFESDKNQRIQVGRKFEYFVFNRYTNPEKRKKLLQNLDRLKIQYRGMRYVRSYYENTESKTRQKALERVRTEIEDLEL